MNAHVLTPRFGVTGQRLDTLSRALDETASETAKQFGTSRAAVITCMIGVLAGIAAKIDRVAASDFFHALAVLLRNPSESADLDRRRVDRCAAALFEADQRRPQV